MRLLLLECFGWDFVQLWWKGRLAGLGVKSMAGTMQSAAVAYL
jgi:hypothetical protein